MSGWSGFTDEELQRMKIENELVRQTENVNVIKISKVGQPQRKKMKEKRVTMHKRQSIESENCVKVPLESHQSSNLGHSVEGVAERKPDKQGEPSDSFVNKDSHPDPDVRSHDLRGESVERGEISENKKNTENGSEKGDDNDIGVLSEKEELKLDMTTLEHLQKKQKIIEDQNKKKQAMIKHTLQERFKQTQCESQKLKDIHKQLNRIDQSFQADVEELRNKIDEACFQFSHAQKRYIRAETEYVAAKLDFFHKKEVKDELTEQLYAIIQENEMKKSKKLEELMSKLANDLVPESLPANAVTNSQNKNDENSAS